MTISINKVDHFLLNFSTQNTNAAKTMKSKARMVLDITEESGDKFGLWDFFALNNVLTSSVVTSFVTEKRKEEGF